MQIIPLESEAALNEILTGKLDGAILKHNTECSISEGVLDKLKAANETAGSLPIYLIDLHRYRALSNLVTGRLGIPHQSPQVLLIKNGRCVYHEWGFDITAAALASVADR